MNIKVTTGVYFLIWLATLVIFFLQIQFSNQLKSITLISNIFDVVLLLDILTGVFTFILGLISLFRKKRELNENKDKKIQEKVKPKFLFLIVFFIFFISSLIFLLISNNPTFTSDTTQFSRFIILALLSSISLIFFIAYLSTYPSKLVKKNELNRERASMTFKVGNLIISGFLATCISILFIFIIMPFMQVADGLSFAEKAKIGGINMWRVVIMYAFLTALITYFTFSKKIYKSLAVVLIIFWVIGTALVVYIDSTPTKTLVNFNSDKKQDDYITNRSSCDKRVTLQQTKGCVLRILRNDGGHGTGFIIKPGFLITNKHVIEGASKLTVFINGEKEANVWNYSPDLDLAILKLPESSLPNTCSWFDSNQLSIAEELYTFGWPNNPTGDSTVTKGVYSRTNKYEDGAEDIQTDASTNPGNSGGPLVNECGVVGINTMRAEWTQEQSPRVIEGMSFALSSNFIYSKVNELISSGSLSKQIPNASNYQANTQPNNQPRYSLDVNNIKTYLNDIYRAKTSWEQARGHVNEQKLNALIDSFNRQIDFCNHLINKLNSGQQVSGDDINLWKAVIKMGDESAALTYELNRR